MIALSPFKLILTAPMDHSSGGALWFRLARTSDGLLCLEAISDTSLNQPGSSEAWAWLCPCLMTHPEFLCSPRE